MAITQTEVLELWKELRSISEQAISTQYQQVAFIGENERLVEALTSMEESIARIRTILATAREGVS